MGDEDNKEEVGAKNSKDFSAPECPVAGVVVYKDRAEVCRSVKVAIETGSNEVIVKNLPASIDSDSIRVEGKGNATINEVTYSSKHITPDKEETNTHKKEIQEKLKGLKLKKIVLQKRIDRATKQRGVLDDLSDNLVQQPKESKEGSAPLCSYLDDKMFEGLSQFLTFFDKNAGTLDTQVHELGLEMETIDEEIKACQSNLTDIGRPTSNMFREVSILLETDSSSEAELLVSYVVGDAGWTPGYDLRVYSNDNILKVLYYGNIKQSTGEDWTDAPISLSTAQPHIGGTIPRLGTQKVGWKPVEIRPEDLQCRLYTNSVSMAFTSRKSAPRFGSSFRRKKRAVTYDDFEDSEEPMVSTATAEAEESMTSTSFKIARNSTIPSDNNSHRVSIAIIDLQSKLEYESVPRKSEFAFLKARVKNTSNYVMLAGPTSIFLDNNFVAKADLKDVSPQEEFTCSLGVDTAVRITYKPLQRYREQTGYFSKSVVMNQTQKIEIKNTKRIDLKILVTDHLPLSKEEQIKVSLKEPAIKPPSKKPIDTEDKEPIRMNKDNNIEWDLSMPAGSTHELVVKYTVEYPSSKVIQYETTEAFK